MSVIVWNYQILIGIRWVVGTKEKSSFQLPIKTLFLSPCSLETAKKKSFFIEIHYKLSFFEKGKAKNSPACVIN